MDWQLINIIGCHFWPHKNRKIISKKIYKKPNFKHVQALILNSLQLREMDLFYIK